MFSLPNYLLTSVFSLSHTIILWGPAGTTFLKRQGSYLRRLQDYLMNKMSQRLGKIISIIESTDEASVAETSKYIPCFVLLNVFLEGTF